MENSNGKHTGSFSKRLRAGKRRTYFFDVRSTKQGDYFLTITESKKKFEGEGYESHKIFVYKEDFKKFVEAVNETVDYIKTELLPDYDYDAERPAKEVTTNTNHRSSKPAEESISETISEEESKDSSTTPTPQIGDDEQMDWN